VTAEAPAKSVAAYGGGAFDWAPDGTLVYATSTGSLAAVPRTGGPARVLSRDGRASAPSVSPDGRAVAFVLEREDGCDIAVAPVDGSAWPVRVSAGADYTFDPAWAPDARTVVWHEWDFPAMPWDDSRVVGRVVGSGGPEGPGPRTLFARPGVAVGQPRFSPGGDRLSFVCDATGWGVVWAARPDGSKAGPLSHEPHEHAQPTWGPGQRSYAWSPDGRHVALTRNELGSGSLVVAPAGRGRPRDLAPGWHVGLDWSTRGIAAARSAPGVPLEIVVVDPRGGARPIARGPVAGIEEAALPDPEPVEWKGDGGTVHGLLWRPRASAVRPGHKPPLLVLVHGGPTGQATASWNPRADYFRDRGWVVLTPNYRGSSGYGRSYAQALAGRWGDLDVADTADGIRHAARKGWCDPERVAIMGGSAGGFTVLLVCALHGDLVRAGVDLFGVTDLFDLAETTHRFESRYLDRIVGVLPDDADRYRERSPVSHAHRIQVPLLVLQGSDDPAVPQAQADAIVAAVRAAGGDVEYHVYPGEGHGWGHPATVEDEIERVERFLTRHVVLR
jgi:dipeptidyl aminopeptidase/acylaminoacyl peptidase